jgi:hypothetical protein
MADPPSCGDFRLMQAMGAERRQMCFPRLQGYFGELLV